MADIPSHLETANVTTGPLPASLPKGQKGLRPSLMSHPLICALVMGQICVKYCFKAQGAAAFFPDAAAFLSLQY